MGTGFFINEFHIVTNYHVIKNFEKLPEKAKTYILELEKFIGAKVSSISTSPERNDTILIVDPFSN